VSRANPGVDLVVLDCDGVLVDSERPTNAFEIELLAELGWPLTGPEIAERFMGRSSAYMVAEIEAHLGPALPEGWREKLESRYDGVLADLVPIDGVVEALDSIDAMGLATCVASSGSQEKMRFTLGTTGLYDRFAGRIFSGEEVEHGKPAPDLFLHAAQRMGVPPARCVVVEDSPFGVEAARAAGMRALAYSAGGLVDPVRLEGPATVVFDDMRELPNLLARA
jgi:HAD superfamily hydrolase (TIGR01509 family)